VENTVESLNEEIRKRRLYQLVQSESVIHKFIQPPWGIHKLIQSISVKHKFTQSESAIHTLSAQLVVV